VSNLAGFGDVVGSKRLEPQTLGNRGDYVFENSVGALTCFRLFQTNRGDHEADRAAVRLLTRHRPSSGLSVFATYATAKLRVL
jgi:hypothetical protein